MDNDTADSTVQPCKLLPFETWEIWSSGLEEWEPCKVAFSEMMKYMDDMHFKFVGGRKYLIWHCTNTNRWFRQRCDFLMNEMNNSTKDFK